MGTFYQQIEFEVHTCDCGITWAFPVNFGKRRREDHKSFYCPNGCTRYYPKESTEDKLKRQLENTKGQLKNAQECCIEYEDKVNTLERSRDSYKGHFNRLKREKSSEGGRNGEEPVNE